MQSRYFEHIACLVLNMLSHLVLWLWGVGPTSAPPGSHCVASEKSLSFSEAQGSHSKRRIVMLAPTDGRAYCTDFHYNHSGGKSFASYKVLGKGQVSVGLTFKKALIMKNKLLWSGCRNKVCRRTRWLCKKIVCLENEWERKGGLKVFQVKVGPPEWPGRACGCSGTSPGFWGKGSHSISWQETRAWWQIQRQQWLWWR